ncbi:hypothetical protein B0J17DRAFT_668894 [Rhizoctonia solani]|nr:hypothetical protein B0J17DRAFT_668894 [Rhizoctonia solani]
MTFVKAVCTRVNYLYGDRLDPPTPEPEYPYRGPSRPLHATQWVPLEHRSLPPISINPPPNQPLYLLLSFFVLLESYRFLRPKLRFWLGGTSSRSGPLFPGTLPPSPQPALSQVYPEPSPLRPPNEFITRPTNPSNANSGPSQVSWGHSPGSPPSRYSNATDALPYGSSAAMSDSNRQR